MAGEWTREELEEAFEMIAKALDAAGPAQETMLLAKLALELSHRLGDLEALRQALAAAAADLEDDSA